MLADEGLSFSLMTVHTDGEADAEMSISNSALTWQLDEVEPRNHLLLVVPSCAANVGVP